MKTTYFIFEKWGQQTLRGSQQLRSTDGFEGMVKIEAESETEAIAQWLSDKSDAYDIIMDDEASIAEYGIENRKPNAWYGCASEALVFEPGDTIARFGDYDVRAFTESEVIDDRNKELAAIKANLLEAPEEK